MSVVMTLRVEGDATELEKLAAEDPTFFANTTAKGKEFGLIAHHFYANDRDVLVVDEWPSEEAFHSFFDAAGPEIQQAMSRAGVTSEPAITFWRKLELGDDVG